MTNYTQWQILLLAKENNYQFPGTSVHFNLDITWIESCEQMLADDFVLIPDIILVKDTMQNLQGRVLISEIKRKWQKSPVVMIVSESNIHIINEVFTAGCFDFIREPFFDEDLLSVLSKCKFCTEKKEENKFLVNNLNNLISQLQENNTIFKTIIELITHDSKNQFYYISTIVNQIQDKNLKEILENAIYELNECILEAYGYLNGKKRICSAVSLIENLRLEKKRILLKNHSRIRFSHDANYILFINVSALFKNAIANVVENALKYSPSQSEILVNLFRKGQIIIIKIIDQGPGISEDNKKNIFDWNFRIETDSILEGTGKGLWITRNIVEKEGGTVLISDNSGGGSVFEIQIPAFKIENYKTEVGKLSEWFDIPPLSIQHKIKVLQTFLNLQQISPEYEMESIIYANLVQLLREEVLTKKRKYFYKKLIELKSLNPDGKTVLIIDDSIHVHFYLAAHLTDIGYRVAGFASNGADGVSFYETLKPDLVTMDSTMPIMSGTEAAAEIVKINPAARILFVTGFGEHPRFVQNVKANIPIENYRIIKKPFKKEDLKQVLKEFCE